MIEAAEREGILKPDSILVEPTSGNQGIGIAMVGAIKGYQVKIIMPASVSIERRKLVEQYGAEVIIVQDEDNIGATVKKCIQAALSWANKDKRVFVPQQFENPNNPLIHRNTTVEEILSQYDGTIDVFCSGIGTGGTITGIGEVLKERYSDIKIVAVEPENGAVISGKKLGQHQQQGIGDGVIPPILNLSMIDEIITVTDEQALTTAKRLACEEGLLVGISSGSNVWVALQLAKRLGKDKTILTILPDTGERYFSTALFDN
jgi:cysteine synthase A